MAGMQTDIGVPGAYGAERLARDVFGTVYRAHHRDAQTDLAIRVLDAERAHPAAAARAAEYAGSIGQQVIHPHLIRVYSHGTTTAGHRFLVCELATGGVLADGLGDGGRLPWQDAAALVVEVAGALQTAHAAHIVHGAVNPASIWLDSAGRPKLADFGMLGLLASLPAAAVDDIVAYAPPELRQGILPTPTSDVYALAAVFVALVTGTPPRQGQMPPDLAGSGVPPELAAVITLALEPDLQSRIATAEEFALSLMGLLASLGLPAGDYRAFVSARPDEPGTAQSAPSATESDDPTVPQPAVEETYPTQVLPINPLPINPLPGRSSWAEESWTQIVSESSEQSSPSQGSRREDARGQNLPSEGSRREDARGQDSPTSALPTGDQGTANAAGEAAPPADGLEPTVPQPAVPRPATQTSGPPATQTSAPTATQASVPPTTRASAAGTNAIRPMTAPPAPAPEPGRAPASHPVRTEQVPNAAGSTVRRRTDGRHRADGSRITPVIIVSWFVIAVAIAAIVAMLAFRS